MGSVPREVGDHQTRMSITFNAITHAYTGQKGTVLEAVDLEVAAGEIVSVLGPSGSGKSTLLRLAAGLESVQQGKLTIAGDVVADAGHHPPPEARGTALVFQDHVLFPHLTVTANVQFGMTGIPAGQRESRAQGLLDDLGVGAFATRFPHTLSGGQQQRVALARALAVDPSVLLLDEPFASVDLALRRSLQEDARHTLKAGVTATLLVTHDPEEAMIMSDRIACLVDGRVVQVGRPEELWREPAHPFIAQTIAGMQPFPGSSDGHVIETAFGPIELASPSGACTVCVRPAGVTVEAGDTCRVDDIRFSDGNYQAIVVAGDERLQVSLAGNSAVSAGDSVALAFAPEQLTVYPARQE